MGKRPRTKMPVEQRAKQFAPFKSLDGLDAAIRRAEAENRRMRESKGVQNVAADDTEYSDDKSGLL